MKVFKKVKKVITKKLVIEALRSEKLMSGDWFHDDFDNLKDCAVCAVGAVLRRCSALSVLIKRTERDDNYNINDRIRGIIRASNVGYDSSWRDVLTHLKRKNYLAALSAKFEQLVSDSAETEPTETQRESLVDFVKVYFPNKFTIIV